jgi:hypothetical protein
MTGITKDLVHVEKLNRALNRQVGLKLLEQWLSQTRGRKSVDRKSY